MKKYGYTREDVLAAAADKSIEVDPRHFEGYDAEEEPKAKKAKEPKEKKVKEPKEPKEKKVKEPKEPKEKKAKEAKPKGRPAKAKKVAEPSDDDMFANLVAEAQESEKEDEPVAEPVAEEDNEPEVVAKLVFNGKKYLKSKKTGIIYDYAEYTQNQEQVVVGKWNEETKKIDFKEESDDEEEEEEEYAM